MSKELFVSSTPHEIRVALVEDGQLSEVYYERENEYTLAGSIYKGRVTRVLPGMQSAFVDLGLERDAFLYVSDFFEMEEDDEDFEPVAVNRQPGGQRQERPQQSRPEQFRRTEQGAGGGGSSEVRPGAEAAGGAPYVFEGGEDFEGEGAEGSGVEAKSEEVSGGEAAGGARAESGAEGERGSRPWGGRRRRRGRRGRGFPDAKFSRPSEGREADGPGDDQRSEGAQEQPGGNEETQPNVLAAFPEADSERGLELVSEAGLEPDLEVRPAPVSDRGQRDQGRRDQSTRGHERGSGERYQSGRNQSGRNQSERSHQAPTPAAPRGAGGEGSSRRSAESSEAPWPGYQPIVLPGESISKYRRMAEQQSAPAGVETEKAQVAKATEVPARAEAKVSEAQIAGFQFSGTQLSGTQLSGTGFSEVQPSEVQPEVPRPTEAAFTETQLTEQGIIEVTEEESESPAAELPPAREEHGRAGEGAAGWQARREESVIPAPHFPSPIPPPQLPPPPPAERGNEQESQGGGERKGLFRRMSGIFGGRSSTPPAPDAAAQERERSKALSVSEGVPAHEAEPWRSHTENVAKLIETQVGGGAAEFESNLPKGAGDSYEQSHAVEDEAKAERTPDERQFLASPFVRSMEEEEIDEEEDDADLAAVGAGFDEEDMEFEELEEESFEPGRREAAATGDEITHAGDDRHMEHGAGDEPFESASAVEERAEGEEGANGRAELRGRPATAPYQQRTERPQFDRRSRGRRGSGGRHMRPRESQRPQIMISDILKEGQEILVQIAKEPIGKKGARITSHIALPGRFMVYMPTVNHIGVSRKISSDEERQRLKRMVSAERENGHGGFIVRTAAEGIHEDELLADIRFLKNLWAEIKQRSETSKPPSLIYHDLNLVERTLRDLVTEDFTHIWVDNEPEYERVLRFVNRFQPGLVRRVRLYTKETPLYEQFGIQEEINKALKSKVWLKSGGYIVINQTEALVAIDVNTGKYVGKTQRLEDTIVKTNVDAIKEIVRQIRLRDLGGIIVVDFIDMDERKNRQKVMQALEEALVHDRAPSKVLAFNDFGLVAITRKRVKHSLERVLGAPCNYCTGTGLVKSVTTICNEIYIELKKLRKQFESDRDILLRVNPEVAKELKANNSRWLNDLEELAGRPIILKPDPLLHQEQFDM